MHVIVGGTGQVGSATARAFLQHGERVTIVTRDPHHGAALRDAGATIAVADVLDAISVRELFRSGRRAFLLNPPAPPTTDTDAEERASGTLPSFLPADMAIPMVAPQDLGDAAARRLLEPAGAVALRYVEGARHYTPRDVAAAFARALGIAVDVSVLPREAWEATFRQIGFSAAAGSSYACMTRTVVDDGPEQPDAPERGRTSLQSSMEDVERGAT